MNKKKKDILPEKSHAFALDIIKLYKFLVSEKKEDVMSKQLDFDRINPFFRIISS